MSVDGIATRIAHARALLLEGYHGKRDAAVGAAIMDLLDALADPGASTGDIYRPLRDLRSLASPPAPPSVQGGSVEQLGAYTLSVRMRLNRGGAVVLRLRATEGAGPLTGEHVELALQLLRAGSDVVLDGKVPGADG